MTCDVVFGGSVPCWFSRLGSKLKKQQINFQKIPPGDLMSDIIMKKIGGVDKMGTVAVQSGRYKSIGFTLN